MAQAHSIPLTKTAPQEIPAKFLEATRFFFRAPFKAPHKTPRTRFWWDEESRLSKKRNQKYKTTQGQLFPKALFLLPMCFTSWRRALLSSCFQNRYCTTPNTFFMDFLTSVTLVPHLSLRCADSILPLLWNLKAHNSYCHKWEAKVGTSLKSLIVCRQNAF